MATSLRKTATVSTARMRCMIMRYLVTLARDEYCSPRRCAQRSSVESFRPKTAAVDKRNGSSTKADSCSLTPSQLTRKGYIAVNVGLTIEWPVSQTIKITSDSTVSRLFPILAVKRHNSGRKHLSIVEAAQVYAPVIRVRTRLIEAFDTASSAKEMFCLFLPETIARLRVRRGD